MMDNLIEHVQQNLLFTHCNDVRNLQIHDPLDPFSPGVKIARGCWLNQRAFEGLDYFLRSQVVHIARAIYALHTIPDATLAGPTGLLCAGVEQLWSFNLPVYIFLPDEVSYHACTFPAVTFSDGTVVSAQPLRRTRLDFPHSSPGVTTNGLRALPVLECAIQCARMLEPEQGFVALLMAAQKVCECDPRDRTRGEKQLVNLKQQLNAISKRLEKRARGKLLLRRAAAGLVQPVESVLEARLVWRLHQACLTGFTMQRQVNTREHSYFIDCAFDEHMLAIELDGLSKYALNPEGPDVAKTLERQRQREIEAKGWRFLRFTWEDFQGKRDIAACIQAELL